MKIKTRVRAGGLSANHNQTLVCNAPMTKGLRVKSHVKAGGLSSNHNETLVHDSPHKSRGT
jgi:hypothetical protein